MLKIVLFMKFMIRVLKFGQNYLKIRKIIKIN